MVKIHYLDMRTGQVACRKLNPLATTTNSSEVTCLNCARSIIFRNRTGYSLSRWQALVRQRDGEHVCFRRWGDSWALFSCPHHGPRALLWHDQHADYQEAIQKAEAWAAQHGFIVMKGEDHENRNKA